MNDYGKPLSQAESTEFTKAIESMEDLEIKEPEDKKGDEVTDKQGELF